MKLQTEGYSKKNLWRRGFLLNFVKFLRANFFKDHLQAVDSDF